MRLNAKRNFLAAGLLAGVSMLVPGLVADRFAAAPSLNALFIAPAYALNGVAKADDISIETNAVTYTIKHVEATGTDLTDDGLEALFDDESKTPITERMTKLTAAGVSIPEIIAEIEIGDGKATITYHDIKLSDVKKGVAASLAIGGADVAIQNDKNDAKAAVKIGAITASKIDFTAILHSLFDVRSDDNEPLKTQYEALDINNITLAAGKEVQFSIGKISVRDVAGRAHKLAFPDFADKIAAMAADEPKPEQMQEFAAIYADMLRSLSVGGMEMRDFALAVDVPPNPGKAKIGRMAVTGLSGGKLGEIAYEDFDLDTAKAKMKLGGVSMRGFDLRPLLELADTYSEKGEEGVTAADPRAFVPTLDHFGVKGVDIDAAAEQGQRGNAANGARNAFQLGNFSIDAGGYIGGIPTNANVALDHLAVDLSALANEPDMKEFFAMGYRKVDVSAKLDLGFNEATSELAVKNLSVQSLGMGSVAASATLGNVNKDLFSSNVSLMTATALGALIKTVNVSIVNDGIFEKALQAESAKQKKSPEELRTMLVAGASVGIPSILGDSPAARTIANAVAKFLAQPKNLKIVASSADGLGAADLGLIQDPTALLKKIDVKASINE